MSTTVERETFLDGVGKYENVRITKNVIILGVAFMLHFTAFHGTANLQSSINTDGSLGTYTLASIYGSLIVSNIFLPTLVIRWLGCKWTIALSFIVYMPFIAAQFYPVFYTMVPAGLLVGFGGGPLWCAKCTYLTVVAEAFATLLKGETKQEVLVVRFFGLFFIFYQMAQVWGNLISSSILSSSIGGGTINVFTNITPGGHDAVQKNVGELCGAQFCPGIANAIDNPNLIAPHPLKIQILSGIFLALMLAAVALVALFTDSLKRYEMGRKGANSHLSGFRLLAVTVQHMFQWKQLLMLPITMFIGAEMGFIAVDFTASFVACGWGIPNIGYAMICFGISNAVAAAFAGGLSKCLGRFPMMLGTFIAHMSLLVWMRLWVAVDSDFVTYFTMAGIWGLVDGIWLVQVNSFYGVLFPGHEEAAFSNFRLFESMGSVTAYSLSPILCTALKLELLAGLLVVGVICYAIVESMWRKDNSHQTAIEMTNVTGDTNGYDMKIS